MNAPSARPFTPEANPRLAELQTLARELKSLTASVHSAPAKLDRSSRSLRQELRDREGWPSPRPAEAKVSGSRSAASFRPAATRQANLSFRGPRGTGFGKCQR